MDCHQDVLFGLAAPSGLGEKTLDQVLKWSRPSRSLLETFVAGVRDAVKRGVRHALSAFLVAMLWEWPGYTISEAEAFLGPEPQLLCASGAGLGRLLCDENASALHVERAVQFWRLALTNNRNPDGLKGFGQLARVDMLDDALWAELTIDTLNSTGGRIDGSRDVAKRAASMPSRRITLKLIDGLVRRVDGWNRYEVEEQASKLLREAIGLSATEDYLRLRTALLERGVHV